MAVLDRDGQPVGAAACGFHRRSSLGFHPELSASSLTEELSGTWLFGGVNSHHFGHMITRSLGRLAGLGGSQSFHGIVFANTDRRSSDTSNIDLLARLLRALNINTPIKILQRPTRIEQIFVGRDQFSELTRCHATPEFVSWSRKTLLPANEGPRPGSRLYVTRSMFDPTAGGILCEDVLEGNLKGLHFEVFAPEKHSIEDQILKYCRSETIVTNDGSHVHLMALCRQSFQKIAVIKRRREPQPLIENHVESFGNGLSNSSHLFLEALTKEWWPSARTSNRSRAELDFAVVRDTLQEFCEIPVEDFQDWRTPTSAELKSARNNMLGPGEWVIPEAERVAFMSKYRAKKYSSKETKNVAMQEIAGQLSDSTGYLRVLSRIHQQLKPDWYLEIGTNKGSSLKLATSNFVSVDPNFLLKNPVLQNTNKQMHFFQQTSDAFFASGFLARNEITVDLAFLDGLHHFEFLLRDFINTERHMAKDGVIALHDCCPTTIEMTSRIQCPGAWTGDVWKTLLILLKYRPDLDIMVSSAAPTGLVLIRNTNPKSTLLPENYERIVEEYDNLTLDDLPGGLQGYYQNFDLHSPEDSLSRL